MNFFESIHFHSFPFSDFLKILFPFYFAKHLDPFIRFVSIFSQYTRLDPWGHARAATRICCPNQRTDPIVLVDYNCLLCLKPSSVANPGKYFLSTYDGVASLML